MPRRLFLAASLLAAFILADARAASSQTVDDLFNPGTLQEIRLWINSRDLNSLHERFMEDTYYTADLEWRGVRVRNAGVRSRGGASRSGTKPALRVDFDRYVSDRRFLGLKSIILKNLWQDGSMMHDAIAMSFFARMGQPASRESFCRLFVNNEYQGLYAIVESVDNDYLTRNFGESAGYLFAYELINPFKAEDLGDDLAVYRPLFQPENHERESDQALYGPIRDLLREVNAPDDAVWRERVEQYVDLPQFITQVAIENFLAEDDGLLGANGMNNFYLYRQGGTTRHRFIAWDKDNTFLLTDYQILLRADDNVLFRRAFAYPDLRDLYFQVLDTAARSASEDGWMEGEVVRIAELVAQSVEEDTQKSFSTEAFYESVDVMRAFARERSANVLSQIAATRSAAQARLVRE